MILDEEQRFGVAQKELLRQMRLEVDVLALSATPIPRTLHMSLAGIRDITVIETAPHGRRPIATHVGEYDEALVKMAIERELERDGQVFVLHNRVETIDEAIAWLERSPLNGSGMEIELRVVGESQHFGDAFTPELQEQERRTRELVAANATGQEAHR